MRRVQRGTPVTAPSARDQNALAEVADLFQNTQRAAPPSDPDQNRIRILNDTGAELDAWTIVGLDIATQADDQGKIAAHKAYRFRSRLELNAIDYDPDAHWNRYALTSRAVPDQSVGDAQFKGQTAGLLNVRNEHHKYAEPDPDDLTRFRSAWHGTPILWSETLTDDESDDVAAGTPVQTLALLWIDPQPGIVVAGYLESDLGPAAAAGSVLTETESTLRVWIHDSDGNWITSGTTDAATITITNQDETLNVATGTYIRAQSDGVRWTPFWASCSPTLLE